MSNPITVSQPKDTTSAEQNLAAQHNDYVRQTKHVRLSKKRRWLLLVFMGIMASANLIGAGSILVQDKQRQQAGEMQQQKLEKQNRNSQSTISHETRQDVEVIISLDKDRINKDETATLGLTVVNNSNGTKEWPSTTAPGGCGPASYELDGKQGVTGNKDCAQENTTFRLSARASENRSFKLLGRDIGPGCKKVVGIWGSYRSTDLEICVKS